MTFKKSVCCGSRLINDNIISVCKHVMLCFVTTSRTEKGCGKWHFFWSEILPGFGEPGGGTPLPRIPFIPFMPFIPQNYNNSIYNSASCHPFFYFFFKIHFLNLRKHNIATFFSRTPMKWDNNRHLIMRKKNCSDCRTYNKRLRGVPGSNLKNRTMRNSCQWPFGCLLLICARALIHHPSPLQRSQSIAFRRGFPSLAQINDHKTPHSTPF